MIDGNDKRQLRASIREMATLLERIGRYHGNIPDVPLWPAGTIGRAYQLARFAAARGRKLLADAKSKRSVGGEPR